jgi:hypothetical protein
LQSSRQYRIHFAGEPDVSEFWSLTLYDSDDRLAKHPAERYSVGSSLPLKKNTDGSFDIVVAPAQPAIASNWLSPPVQGNFTLLLRYYGPSAKILEQLESTPLPSIIPLQSGSQQ